jgi:peroxiredoxin
MIQIGDSIPDVQVMQMSADGPTPVQTHTLFNEGLVILFATPGAFTPTCSAQHLPGYLEKADALKACGVREIICMAVNDVFVVDAWQKASGVDGKIAMIADGNGDFARAMGLDMDIRAFGMGERSQRFAMIINEGVVKELMVEAPGEFKVSSAEAVLNSLS